MKKIIISILILAIIFSVAAYYKKTKSKPVDTNIYSYRNLNLGVSFKYPKQLTVKGNNEEITIHHEVPFEHHDYCDFKGESTTTSPTLTDFNVTMHISDKNLIDTIRRESPYIPEENFLNGNIIPSPGFIDQAVFGKLEGYSIFEGAEGCGHTIYYLKISSGRTLVVINDFITIFSGSIDTENMSRAQAVPGVINKAEAEGIFQLILNSLSL